jgi:methionyl-tRNA synthetase
VHLFIRIEAMHSFLEEWTQSGKHLQPEIANYLRGHFLGEPLRDWDVSRPAPYFGFEIPDSPGQYWYVWFDAPIGYIGSMTEWCNQSAQDPLTWWNRGEAGSEVEGEAEIHHFIGKDIAYFHTLFWPAVLRAAGFQLPSHVHIHGFLTVNGEKMSKSKGTFIRASTYLQHLDPAYLRYYYATKSTPKLDDLDLSFADFIDKVNADLVGKVVNLASRTARFVHQTGLSAEDFRGADGGLFEQAAADADSIAAAYEARDYNTAMRTIMLVADRANRYVDEEAPWTLRKDPGKAAELQQVCTVALNLFRQIAVFLTPVLPRLADQTGSLLNSPIHNWDEVKTPLLGTPVGAFEHMMKRVDEKQVAALVSESAETVPPSESESESDPVSESESESESESDTSAAATDDSPEALAAEPLSPEVNIDEFNKVDLRVARVLEAKEVKESNRLLQLTVTLGGDHRRSIFAGIKGVYRPEQLVGRLVIICANLAPRKMKFGTSEGMVLAAGPGGKDIFILAPDSGAKPGQRVH